MKAFLACMLALLMSVAVFGQQFDSYAATVRVSQTPVRSAPFADQYASAYLNQGEQVQVYRETRNGFLAIRPLHDSYSWVRADELELHSDGEHATVRRSRVPSWIGSFRDESVNYGYTVLLNKGEVVTVLGRQELTLSSGRQAQQYFKIAPPAGEFRWVHKQFIERANVQIPLTRPSNTDLESDVVLASYDDTASSSTDVSGWGTANYIPRWIKPSEFLKVRMQDRVKRDRAVPARKPDADTPFQVASFQTQPTDTKTVSELEIAISEMATRSSDSWDIGFLRDQANRLLSSSSAAQQGAIERLIQRLDQYQKIKDEKQQIASTNLSSLPPRSTDLNTRKLPFEEADINAAGEIGSGVLSAEARRTAYTETGYLVRVRSTRNDAPEYALVDAQGEVKVFISPQLGLNLSTYVRRHVGVFGRRGYLYRLKTQHVTVDRVVDLARHKKPVNDLAN